MGICSRHWVRAFANNCKRTCAWNVAGAQPGGQALTSQGKLGFHKGLKVIRCCLCSPGKSHENHPHLVANLLAQPFIIELSCIPFKRASVSTQSLVSTIKKIASVIKYVLL